MVFRREDTAKMIFPKTWQCGMQHRLFLIEQIRIDPRRYLAYPSLSRLFSFMAGHDTGREDTGVAAPLFSYRESFHRWLARRLLGVEYASGLEEMGKRFLENVLAGQAKKPLEESLLWATEESMLALASEDDVQGFTLFYDCWDGWKNDCLLSEHPARESLETGTRSTRGLLEFLEFIKGKPNHPIWSYSVTQLRAFIDGYLCACHDLGRTPDGDIDFVAFGRWLQLTLPLKHEYRWEKLLLFRFDNDEVKAFQKFFELLERFREGQQ